jgi:Beta protein
MQIFEFALWGVLPLFADSRVSKCRGLAFPGSSFPKSVGVKPYGEDAEGKFSALELPLFASLKRTFPNMPLVYSDFASVHPIRYPTKGGSWVPRIDVFSGGEFAYSRLRAEDDGYVQAAKNIVKEFGPSLPNSWGAEQVKQAAQGILPGRSPSFWISARINMWITQRAQELAGPIS